MLLRLLQPHASLPGYPLLAPDQGVLLLRVRAAGVNVQVVALLYREPYYADTVDCLARCDYPVTYVERNKGAGNMSLAFNRGFELARSAGADLVWFTTDVTFDPRVPRRLAAALLGSPALAAVHPAHPSDHAHHRPDGSGELKAVPYVEFTAPMWRADAFEACGRLDEDHWFWYQDLLISREARSRGYDLAVHHGAEVGHVYRRTDAEPHPVTKMRYDLRRYRDPVEQRLLEKRFGANWREQLWTTL